MDRKDLEIMAPSGNFECLRAAIQGGADSVYFGVGKLNMRSHSANNFSVEDLCSVTAACREAGVRSYLTLNIVMYDEEMGQMKALLDAGVPAAPVNTVDKVAADPHVAGAREMFIKSEHPVMGEYTVVGCPIKLTNHPVTEYRPAPALGADNDELFSELENI